MGLDDRLFLEEMCQYYQLEQSGATLSTLDDTLGVLLSRVDQIPPSIALAQAAIESGWGTSYLSRKRNNLFGQGVWDYGIPALVPFQDEQPRFRLAVFPIIGASAHSYMHNLNTHPAYEDFRRLRQRMRAQGEPLDPVKLARSLQRYSARGEEYVDDVLQFIEFNELTRYDAVTVQVLDETSV